MSNSQKLGSTLEKAALQFFEWYFEEIGYTISKTKLVPSGLQDGFDLQYVLLKNFKKHNVFIECKNYYTSDLKVGEILAKIWQLEANYKPTKNDLFIAISAQKSFKHKNNSEKVTRVIQDKVEFQYEQLDTENHVKQFFALNEEVYEKIYGQKPDFIIDRQKEINRFADRLFSGKALKKVHLNDSQKINYLGDLNIKESLIERKFSNESQQTFYWENTYSLKEIVTENNKVIILGSPGSGKTTELQQFALSLWREGEQNSLTPIYVDLRNFTHNNSIRDFLPDEFDDLMNSILILDGIDEIADINYFKKILALFIQKEPEKKTKYLLSCRTNIYLSIVLTLKDFTIFYIQDINRYDAFSYLKNKIDNAHLTWDSKFLKFIRTPFHLKLIENYLVENLPVPNSTAVLWSDFIDKRLDVEERDKHKSFNKVLIKQKCKELSVLLELMQMSYINEDCLLNFFKSDNQNYNDFIKNPFIEKSIKENGWVFEHKTVQEYFAAKFISQLSFDKILDFIKINGVDKTHPSLYNTISFLLNLLDKTENEVYSKLTAWLLDHEKELLFKCDHDRIDDSLKAKVFQSTFNELCIDKKLWITSNNSLEFKDIARFSECVENYEFLVGFLNDQEEDRIFISAIAIINFYNIDSSQKRELLNKYKNLLLKINSENVISEIISSIRKLDLHRLEPELIQEIIKLYKAKSGSEINYSILQLIDSLENVDLYYAYLVEEYKRIVGLLPRIERNNVHLGNDYLITNIVTKIAEPKNLLFFLNTVLNNRYSHRVPSNFINVLYDKAVKFIVNDTTYIFEILKEVDFSTYYEDEKFLSKLIIETKTENECINYLLKNNRFEVVKYFITYILNLENFHLLYHEVDFSETTEKERYHFRNYINHRSRELAIKFQEDMKIKGMPFEDEQDLLISPDVYDEKKRIKRQNNLDLLFDKEDLIRQIKELIPSKITKKEFLEEKLKWQRENNYSIHDIRYSIITDLVYFDLKKDEDILTHTLIEERLNYDLNILLQIRKLLKRYEYDKQSYSLSSSQKVFIQNWCTKSEKEIDFNCILNFKSENSYSYGKDYTKFNTVFYYFENLGIELSQDFLLNSIKFYRPEDIQEKGDGLHSLKISINNNTEFDKRIIENLKEDNLFSSILNRHILYALNNNLNQSYNDIRRHLLKGDYSYVNYDVLLLYYSRAQDKSLLEELCVNTFSSKCWDSLKILHENNLSSEFCIQVALEHLKSRGYKQNPFSSKNRLFCLLKREDLYNIPHDELGKAYDSYAIRELTKYNHIDVIDFLIQYWMSSTTQYAFEIDFSAFNAVKTYSIIIEMYNAAFKEKTKGFEGHTMRSIFETFVYNLSKHDESYKKVRRQLFKIQRRLKKEDSDVFHINYTIEKAAKVNIAEKSKAFNFSKALVKINSL